MVEDAPAVMKMEEVTAIVVPKASTGIDRDNSAVEERNLIGA